VFVSIDDNEAAHLRLLMDEVFGEANFLAQIVVNLNPKGRQLGRGFATSHEYVLAYARHLPVCLVDGSTSGSDFSMQFLADLTQANVDRSTLTDVTPLGAAWLAGWKAGIWKDAEGFAAQRSSDRQFQPRMDLHVRDERLAGWREAVQRVRPDVDVV
jgi:sugar (pentulose or hexulose) kinase